MTGWTSLAATALVLLAMPLQPAQAQAQDAPERLPVTIRHTRIIQVPPDVMWAELKRMYVDGRKFADQGFAVEPLSGPTAWAGGLRFSRTLPDGRRIERTARISRLEDKARFLALTVAYSEGITVLASYEVRPHPKGSEFQLIAHAEQPVPMTAAEAADPEARAARVRAYAEAEEQALADAWAADGARIEAAPR